MLLWRAVTLAKRGSAKWPVRGDSSSEQSWVMTLDRACHFFSSCSRHFSWYRASPLESFSWVEMELEDDLRKSGRHGG